MLVSKYCDHLPLYRQSQIFSRQGVDFNRSTLANWVDDAAWWLEVLRTRSADHVFASDKDVLERMKHGHPMSRTDDLLP